VRGESSKLNRRRFLAGLGLSALALAGEHTLSRQAFADPGIVAEPVDPKPVFRREFGDKPLRLTSAADAVAAALADAKAIYADDPTNTVFVRYVWVPDWFAPDWAAAEISFAFNSTLSRVPTISRPTSLPIPGGGLLVRLEFEKVASKDEDLAEQIRVYELLAEHESFFHIRGDTLDAINASRVAAILAAEDACEICLSDGTWAAATFLREVPAIAATPAGPAVKGKPGRPAVAARSAACLVRFNGAEHTIPQGPASIRPAARKSKSIHAPFLEPHGITELAELLGTNVPIARFDEWMAYAFSSVNGGLYYQWTGIEKDLKTTIAKFCGNDAAVKLMRSLDETRKGRLDAGLSQSRCMTTFSRVTRRERMTQVFYGSNTPPENGPQLIAVTLDIAEGNKNPLSNPFRSARKFLTYDGGEIIFVLPNGLLAYVVTDNKDDVIASVPDAVAWDHDATDIRTEVGTVRVSSGWSCANCHESNPKNLGWQSVKNDAFGETQRLLTGPVNDATARDRERALQEMALYRANLDSDSRVLNTSRIAYQHQAELATGKNGSRDVVRGLSDAIVGYWNDHVSAVTAAADLGWHFPDELSAQKFLLEIPGTSNNRSTYTEDVIVGRLKDREPVTNTSWLPVLPFLAERAVGFKPEPAPAAAAEGPAKVGDRPRQLLNNFNNKGK